MHNTQTQSKSQMQQEGNKLLNQRWQTDWWFKRGDFYHRIVNYVIVRYKRYNYIQDVTKNFTIRLLRPSNWYSISAWYSLLKVLHWQMQVNTQQMTNIIKMKINVTPLLCERVLAHTNTHYCQIITTTFSVRNILTWFENNLSNIKPITIKSFNCRQTNNRATVRLLHI